MTLGVAVVGVGDVAQRDYLPEFGRLSGKAALSVACGLSEARVRDVAARFGIPRWTTSYVDAVHAEDVDVVLNLTPISVHTEVTLAALEAGKHVFSEKPLALTVAEVERIADEARARELVVVSAPCVMLFPQVVRAAELLAAGTAGRVHSVRGHGLGGVPPWEGYMSDPSPFFAPDGGPLVDMAVYPLHAITGLLGPVREVSAFSTRTRTSFTIADGALAGSTIPVDVDDNWHILLRLRGGTLASVEANNCSAGALASELELRGERATIGISLLDGSQPVLVDLEGEQRSEPVAHERAAGPDHLLGVAHLVECVASGRPPVLGVEHARHVIEILEAAARSVEERRAIDVRSDFPRDGEASDGG